jgi:hypothetical protein
MEIRNPNIEIRNNLKIQMTKTFLSVLSFRFGSLECVSYFVFRI